MAEILFAVLIWFSSVLVAFLGHLSYYDYGKFLVSTKKSSALSQWLLFYYLLLVFICIYLLFSLYMFVGYSAITGCMHAVCGD